MSEGGQPNRIESFPYDAGGTARRRGEAISIRPPSYQEVRRGSNHTGSGLAVRVCVCRQSPRLVAFCAGLLPVVLPRQRGVKSQ